MHKVRQFIRDNGLVINEEDPNQEIFYCTDNGTGLDLIIDQEHPLLMIMCPLGQISSTTASLFLDANFEMVHGAFALSNEDLLVWKINLRLNTLDKEEFDSAIASFRLAMYEHHELISYVLNEEK